MIWSMILISYYALFVFGLTDNIRGPLFPEILAEFKVSDSMGSLMFALSSVSGFMASQISSYLLPRHSRKWILQVASLALGCSLVGTALAPNFITFLVMSILFGLALGVLGLIPNVLVPLGSSPEKKQQLLSGLHAMYGIASFTAPLIVAAIGGSTGNWRWSVGLTCIAPFSLFLYTLHPSHFPHHKKPTFIKAHHEARRLLNFKPQVFLALMVSFSVAAEIMISSRLALYMRRVWHYDLEQSSLCVTGFFLCLLLGRLLFTAVKFRISLPHQLSLSLMATAIALGFGLYLHPYFLMLTGLGIAPFYPMAITWISSEFPDDLDTAVSYMMATDALMLTFMHLLIGKLSDGFGIHQALLSGMGFIFLSLLMVNTYPLFKRRTTEDSKSHSHPPDEGDLK